MGTYTRMQLQLKLKQDVPESVLGILKRVLIERDLGVESILFTHDQVFVPELDHDFFKIDSWYMLFLSTNWDDDLKGGNMYQEKGLWVIDLDVDFKDYGKKIDSFIDWITPYVLGRSKKQYVGWYRVEYYDYTINIYIERKN